MALPLIPVFSLVVLGLVLRRFRLLPADVWIGLERFTYFVLFPPLMFMSIIDGSFAGDAALGLAFALASALVTMTALMLLVRPILPANGPQFASIFQAGIRWNGFIALGVISGMFGREGLALAAVGFAVLSPVNDVLGLLVLNRYGDKRDRPLLRIARSIGTNPLVISIVLAIALVQFGVRVSEPVTSTLNMLGNGTVALGLVCAGAAIDWSGFVSSKPPLAVASVARLVVMPALTAGLAYAIGLSSMTFMIAMMCVAAPVATSTLALVQRNGGDPVLIQDAVALTTVAAAITIPATILLTQILIG
ncbi:MAG TPA: AEC family transporter [Hyphomonadaceae bacterium]|nr:AEC family transporter [Hyphomonadaceae bacterium]